MARMIRRPAPAPLAAEAVSDLATVAANAIAFWDGNVSTWSAFRVALGVEHGESDELSAAISSAWRTARRRALLAEG